MDVRSLVNDARVLLGLLQRSKWGDLHVRTPNGEIFIARPGGSPNPLRRAAARRDDVTAEGHVVRAPHVASVLAIGPERMAVEPGDVVCRLTVLGDVVEITSPRSGIVGEFFVSDGLLVEYETPLFTIVNPL